jgi:D-lactate dehydrogenase (cytochrome)
MEPARADLRALRIDAGVAPPDPVTDPQVLGGYAEDASGYPVAPAAGLLRPGAPEEAAAFLRATAGRGVAILPQAARTSLTGGAVPRGEVIVSCERWTSIGAVREYGGSASVRVGAGVRLSTLQESLADLGWYFPPVPTYHEAMVGGVVATNAGGAATFKYGVTRQWVRGIRVLLAGGDLLEIERGQALARPGERFRIEDAGGRVFEVPTPNHRLPSLRKLSAGYFASDPLDLVDLIVGSEGTLALVVDADLDLVPVPGAVVTALAFVEREGAALQLAAALRDAGRRARSGADPRDPDVRAVEYVDGAGLDLLRRHGDAERLRVNVPEEARGAILLECEMDRWDGREAAEAAILAALDGGGPAHDGPLFRLVRILAAHVPADGMELALPGDEGRASALSAFREAVPKRVNEILAARRRDDPGVRKVGGDLIVPVDRIADALAAWRAALERAGLEHATWGHVSDGNLHPNALARSAAEVERAEAVLLELADDAIGRGGSPLSEHGVGRSALKQEMLRRFVGDAAIARMREIKRALDPEWRLAPGVLLSAHPPGVEDLR